MKSSFIFFSSENKHEKGLIRCGFLTGFYI